MELFGKSFYEGAVQSMIDSGSELLFTSFVEENVRTLTAKMLENAKEEVVIVCNEPFGYSTYMHKDVYAALVGAAVRGVEIVIYLNTDVSRTYLALSEIHSIPVHKLGQLNNNIEFIVVDRKMFRMQCTGIKGTACVNNPSLAIKLLKLLERPKEKQNLLDIDYEWL